MHIHCLNGLLFLSAVILPTIWRYLQLLEAPPYFLGLGLSAFSFSGLVSGPMFGHWSDKTRTTKTIILFSNVFEIVGQYWRMKMYNAMWFWNRSDIPCSCAVMISLTCSVQHICLIGNFMYFMGYSKWLLLSSRLVAGEDILKLYCSISLSKFFVCLWTSLLLWCKPSTLM